MRESAQLAALQDFELPGDCLARAARYAEAVMALAAGTALNGRGRAPALLAEVFLALEYYDDADRFAALSLSRGPGNRRALAVRDQSLPVVGGRAIGAEEAARRGRPVRAYCQNWQ